MTLKKYLKRIASICKRRNQRRSSSDTIQTNPTIGNPYDAIVRGYHEFPGEHALDRVVQNARHPYDLGWRAKLMEEVAKGGSWGDEKNADAVRLSTRDVKAEDGKEMKNMKEQEGEKELTPAATSTPRECGEQASTHYQQQQQQQQQQQPLRLSIKSAHNGVKETVALSDPLQPSTDMVTAKIPDPFVIARKPVVRKPVPSITGTDNSQVKNTALEAFLLLFALGAFGACMVCFVVMELRSRW